MHVDVRTSLRSNIDFVLSSSNIAGKIDVDVCDETLGSDHYPIFVSIDVDVSSYSKETFRFNSTRTDWGEIERLIDESYSDFFTHRPGNTIFSLILFLMHSQSSIHFAPLPC